jgi:hypothetical protein
MKILYSTGFFNRLPEMSSHPFLFNLTRSEHGTITFLSQRFFAKAHPHGQCIMYERAPRFIRSKLDGSAACATLRKCFSVELVRSDSVRQSRKLRRADPVVPGTINRTESHPWCSLLAGNHPETFENRRVIQSGRMHLDRQFSANVCWTVPQHLKFAVQLVMLLGIALPTFASPNLEQQLCDLFVGHSFTIRNFYRGKTLRYGSDGLLLDKAERGYWSRDGMVEFTSVRISQDNRLILQGKRTCVLFDPAKAEFGDVWTGDNVHIEVQLTEDQLGLGAAAAVLQKVLLSSRDHLAPSYWTNCLRHRVDRPDKHSPWECVPHDKQKVPDFAGKKISWDIPPPDTSLRNGMQIYHLKHRVGYLAEAGATIPRLLVGRSSSGSSAGQIWTR